MTENHSYENILRSIRKNNKGIISLEACICVPIFVLALMFFYGLMVDFTGEHIISRAMAQSAESLSMDAYTNDKLYNEIEGLKEILISLYGKTQDNDLNGEYFSSKEKWYASAETADKNYKYFSDEKKEAADTAQKSELIETVRKRFLGFVAGYGTDVENKADKILKETGVVNGVKGLDFSESTVENGTLTMVVKYKQRLVFDFNGLAAFDRKKTVSVDMWGLK